MHRKAIYLEIRQAPKKVFLILSENDFAKAKAFWPEASGYATRGLTLWEIVHCYASGMALWKYHLQRLKQAEDRLAYLERYL